MKIKQYFLTAVFCVMTCHSLLGAAGPCGDAYCNSAEIKGEVDATCHGVGTALVYVPAPAGSASRLCWCKCSCLAGETLVQVGTQRWKSIQSIKAGENVLALQSDGKWKTTKVVWSDGLGTSAKPFPYAIYISLINGTTLITTPDHLFWLPDGSLKRSDRLAPTDSLTLARNQQPIAISQVVAGTYYGPVWNLTATSEEDVSTPFGHLINTAGVISGDWALQRKESEALSKDPQVGTRDYQLKYGLLATRKGKTPQALPQVIMLNKEKNIRFEPFRPINIPLDAINLLPKGSDTAKLGEQFALDVSVPYEMGEYLIGQYRLHYPDVTYQIDWLNNSVNAVAFVNAGRRYVVLYGGLLRHTRIDVEGAGLVIAHELGHHYAGDPKYPGSWASCEGQSDYWGAKIAQRRVWWGAYSFDQTSKGAAQLLDLFTNGLVNSIQPAAATGCGHPQPQCRYDTYLAGMNLGPKPSCSQ